MNETSRLTVRPAGFSIALLTLLALPCATMQAQSSVPPANSAEALLALPDEPGALRFSSSAAFFGQTVKSPPLPSESKLPEASKTEGLIQPGQAAPSLSAGNKVVIGFKDAVSPFAAVGWLASAGWEQLTNGSPNYGTDRGAFGQRLGAAALRDSTETLFSESVIAPILHEDPRYYRMGPSHNFFVRAVYSATRVIITKTDSGKTTPNLANLSGTLAGSALANTYYPPINRGGKQIMLTFGGSLGGSAVGNLVTEFYRDALDIFRSKH